MLRAYLRIVFIFMALGVCEGATIFVDPSATGANSGNSWANAEISLVGALAIAVSGDELWVRGSPSGIHYKATAVADRTASFVVPSGVGMWGGFAGNETSRAQAAPFVNVTILDGDIAGDDIGDNPSNLGQFSENSQHLAILGDACNVDGFIFRHANSFGASVLDGSGILCDHVSVTVSRCIFSGNFCGGAGAAISLDGGALSLVSCEAFINVTGNGSSSSEYGGVIYGKGGAAIAITGCKVHENNPGSGHGCIGATGCSLSLTNCELHDNSQGFSPEIYLSASSSFSADHCLFQSHLSNLSGGYDFILDVPTGTFSDCLLCDFEEGQGLCHQPNGGSLDFNRCIIVGNGGTGNGPGRALVGDDVGSTPTTYGFQNCLIVGNEGMAGIVVARGSGMSMQLRNCTVANNQCVQFGSPANGGPLMATDGSISAANCIVANNVAYDSSRTDPNSAGSRTAIHGAGSIAMTRSCLGPGETSVGTAPTLTSCMISDPRFPVAMSGTWASEPVYDASTGLCTFTSSQPIVGSLVGLFVAPMPLRFGLHFPIISNTATTITAFGNALHYSNRNFTRPDGSTDTGRYTDKAFEVRSFGLLPSSPCIDAGDASLATADDIRGHTRADPMWDDSATVDTGAGSPTWTDVGAIEYRPGFSLGVSVIGTTASASPISFLLHFSRSSITLISSSVSITNGTILGIAGGNQDWQVLVNPISDGPVTCAGGVGTGIDSAGDGSSASTIASITYATPSTTSGTGTGTSSSGSTTSSAPGSSSSPAGGGCGFGVCIAFAVVLMACGLRIGHCRLQS